MSDLAALFARDPMKLTKEDVRSIISIYRDKRKQFNLGGTLAGKVKPASPKANALAAAVKSDDLDI